MRLIKSQAMNLVYFLYYFKTKKHIKGLELIPGIELACCSCLTVTKEKKEEKTNMHDVIYETEDKTFWFGE